MCITRRFFLNKDSLPQNKVIYFTSLREIARTQTSLSFITGISLKKSLVWVRKKRFSINFYNTIKLFIYRFRHNEIPVYIVGIILTTYVLVFHWYRDHFPSQYLSTGRLICYLSHMQTQLIKQIDVFRDIQFYYTKSLFTFFGNWLW